MSSCLVEVMGIESGSGEVRREKHDVGSFIKGELYARIARERIALGDREQTMPLLRRAVETIRSMKDELKPRCLARLALTLFKAGDEAGARTLLDEARRAAADQAHGPDRQATMVAIVGSMAQTGDRDGALKLAQTLEKTMVRYAVRDIIESLTDDEFHLSWFQPEGIKILVAGESFSLKDRGAAKRDLPKIARVVRGIPDPLLQARTFSVIAQLQAKAGDFAAARETADSIPDVKRKDFPDPSEGFCDAIKPATIAILARLQAEAGDRAAASAGLTRAVALSRGIEAADQKIIAQIIIAHNQVAFRQADEAWALVREAIAHAVKQPEPLRSRGLAMLSELQLETGDSVAAYQTVAAIRDNPPFEKISALQSIADWYKKAGDSVTAKKMIRQALDCVEARPPDHARAQMGKWRPHPLLATSEGFVDFEFELEPQWAEWQRIEHSVQLRAQLGEIEAAVRKVRALPARERDVQLPRLAAALARNGDIAGALRLAATLETAEERLTAVGMTINAIDNRQTTR